MTDTEWTSISVTESQKETLQDRKPDNVAMGKFLVGAIDFNSNSHTVTVEAEDMQPMIREEIVDAMSEASINVTIDGESDMNEEDVRTMIETEIDALKRELRR